MCRPCGSVVSSAWWCQCSAAVRELWMPVHQLRHLLKLLMFEHGLRRDIVFAVVPHNVPGASVLQITRVTHAPRAISLASARLQRLQRCTAWNWYQPVCWFTCTCQRERMKKWMAFHGRAPTHACIWSRVVHACAQASVICRGGLLYTADAAVRTLVPGEV